MNIAELKKLLETVPAGPWTVEEKTKGARGAADPFGRIIESKVGANLFPVCTVSSWVGPFSTEFGDSTQLADALADWVAACNPETIGNLLAEIDRLRDLLMQR